MRALDPVGLERHPDNETVIVGQRHQLDVIGRDPQPLPGTDGGAERADTARYALLEAELNRLGYHALNSWRDVPRAIEVFRLNVRAFPQSGDVFDSLAEAYLAQGGTVRARANYRRSLELEAPWQVRSGFRAWSCV